MTIVDGVGKAGASLGGMMDGRAARRPRTAHHNPRSSMTRAARAEVGRVTVASSSILDIQIIARSKFRKGIRARAEGAVAKVGT